MISIESFKVENLRCIENSEYVDLKPITILVGRNSSGKSTLARVFPLLRQSAEASKRGPILWWGRLVDFGSFEEAIYRNSKDNEIGLSFKISFDAEDFRTGIRRELGRLSLLRINQSGEMTISLKFKNSNTGTYTSSINISIYDFNAKIFIDELGYITEIDAGEYNWKQTDNLICLAQQDHLIPSPIFVKKTDSGIELIDTTGVDLRNAIRSLAHGNTAEERIRRIAHRLPLGNKLDVFERLISSSELASFSESLQSCGPESKIFKKIYDLGFSSQLDVLLEQANKSIHAFLNKVIYLEPLRATAQRYYRKQALSVREIDSKGENIAEFLDSLSGPQKRSFQSWMHKHFGIEVTTKNKGGHISLTIKQTNSTAPTNIADMGFGFSQMLPIAAQLWAAGNLDFTDHSRKKESINSLIVIEQPELHLHPEYQSKIADVFVAAVNNEENNTNGTKLKIIAETHSSALINKLGYLISEKIIQKEDVQVILFEQAENLSSELTIAEFDDDGILRNWPFGFFEVNLVD